ncbi:hypothetical protein NEOLEDRAFT_1168126 [Neolentinus lepideus HHB14362 ss-1]|uniref:Uncharacterized protein n=1 Tax=Neolentinus lepideus HHB14362 ss-1 TaxID=1314782 RepID=A0A165U5W6_9AGAM|nr:hypothetical protein NEOLEDRAFT_1168126 [Neolentinus lepideus HHB14362 ss-1]
MSLDFYTGVFALAALGTRTMFAGWIGHRAHSPVPQNFQVLNALLSGFRDVRWPSWPISLVRDNTCYSPKTNTDQHLSCLPYIHQFTIGCLLSRNYIKPNLLTTTAVVERQGFSHQRIRAGWILGVCGRR